MKLAVIMLVLSLCLMVNMAYPEPSYFMQPVPWPPVGAQVDADYPSTPEHLHECANKRCEKGKFKCFNPIP